MRLKGSKGTISVVVPVYNVEPYLRQCIESLLAQEMQPLEIILVDDGSPDGSAAICDEYAALYGHIKVIHKENGGLSSARKEGWKRAQGELIVFVDSDDYVSPAYLRELSVPMQNPEVEMSMCGYFTDYGNRIVANKLPYKRPVITSEEKHEMYTIRFMGSVACTDTFNIPGFVCIRMYRTSLLHESDFVSEREYFTEDVLMNILYAKRNRGSIAVIKEPLYFYRVNPGSLTLKYREGAFRMLYACNCLCRRLTQDLGANPVELKRRLDANLNATVTYSIYNIGRIRNYPRFKKELKEIFSTEEVKALFASGAWPKAATWHKIIYYSYRLKAYFLLYKLLKLRKTL